MLLQHRIGLFSALCLMACPGPTQTPRPGPRAEPRPSASAREAAQRQLKALHTALAKAGAGEEVDTGPILRRFVKSVPKPCVGTGTLTLAVDDADRPEGLVMLRWPARYERCPDSREEQPRRPASPPPQGCAVTVVKQGARYALAAQVFKSEALGRDSDAVSVGWKVTAGGQSVLRLGYKGPDECSSDDTPDPSTSQWEELHCLSGGRFHTLQTIELESEDKHAGGSHTRTGTLTWLTLGKPPRDVLSFVREVEQVSRSYGGGGERTHRVRNVDHYRINRACTKLVPLEGAALKAIRKLDRDEQLPPDEAPAKK